MNPTFDPTSLPLRDIHLPQPVGWWPPAPGWWVAALLLAVLAVWGVLRYRRGRAKRAALRALAGALRGLGAGEAPARCAQQVSIVLRRYALTGAGNGADVAGLVGRRWLEYLDGRWTRREFTEGSGQRLVLAPYAAETGADEARKLAQLGVAWLKAQPR